MPHARRHAIRLALLGASFATGLGCSREVHELAPASERADAPDEPGTPATGVVAPVPQARPSLSPDVLPLAALELQHLLEDGDDPAYITVGHERIFTSRWLPALYERRGYQPAWLDVGGPRAAADTLLTAIDEAATHGLNPADYHREALRARREAFDAARGQAPEALAATMAALEVLLSDAFLLLGEHLLAGRVDPATVHADWEATRKEADLTALFEEVFAEDGGPVEQRLTAALAALPPPHPGYAQLREALGRYRALAARGGWAPIADGPVIKAGDKGPRVQAVRARLHATGELPEAAPDDPSAPFDEGLAAAVGRFQAHHGLAATGQVDAETRAAMNVPAARRAVQIELALERWRWLPHDLGQRHLLVNVANFELDLVEDGHVVGTRRVVVGRAYRRTPSLSGRISHIVLNPVWTVPRTIAVQDLLPEARRNPSALARRGIRAYARGDFSREIPLKDVPWKKLSANNFPYVLRQDPGPQNALGRMKFMFPNPHHVYLHDTPTRDLFHRTSRDFSSGCIRVEKPQVLAEWLLQGTPRWSPDALRRVLGSDKEQTVWLAERVPVHISYWTVFVDPEGVVQFRNDIYSRDAELDRALHAAPPS